ncbi:MAG: aminotransferase class I/II-fold pyridoxal phosphate-dependent enzyme [Lachnospiraceae bacterium]|nr:aminotransferase class I/II-fold pyridoxal phosphate-dependent enzyme [Lachnospiraceae bacterium]
MEDNCKFNTALLHGKGTQGYGQREILPPICQVSAFQYESMEELEKVFAHKSMGYAYTRIGNPSLAAFERKINELEHGNGAVCCSSGMSAIASALLAVCKSGDEIIAGSGLYGGTIDLFHDLEKLGIHTVFAGKMTGDEIESLITDKTRVVFGELISNPSLAVMDIPKLAEAAHKAGIPLFVDSTTATPFIARPLTLGADVVIHSTSKYINGGGNSIGGIIVDGGKFNWDFGKHTALEEFKKYGRMAFSVRLRTDIWENLGGCMAPMNAYLSYVGVETLGLRMEKICRNADALAKALSKEPDIKVNYLTLPDHPYNGYVDTELNGYGGGILNFRAGSKERAFRIINSLKYALIASNIGDLRTLVIHPFSTLYIRTGREETEAAGVFEDTIRVSVGIEDEDDLVSDFIRAVRESRE